MSEAVVTMEAWPNLAARRTSCVVRMAPSKNWRRLTNVSLMLSYIGMPHELTLPLLDFLWRHRLIRQALANPECRVSPVTRRRVGLMITDDARLVEWRTRQGLKTVRIFLKQSALSATVVRHSVSIPLFFHPVQLNGNGYETANRLAVQDQRAFRAVFAGSCSPSSYGRPQPGGLSNRLEVLEAVRSLPSGLTAFPQTAGDLRSLAQSGEGRKRLVWIDTKILRIAREEWLSFLGQVDYFLCAPGVHYPFCHHLNEAMACGAVPILQHGDFYTPALQDGVNSLQYRILSELEPLLHSVLSASTEQWRRQSRCAKLYHDAYLSPAQVLRTLTAFLEDDGALEMHWQMAGRTGV